MEDQTVRVYEFAWKMELTGGAKCTATSEEEARMAMENELGKAVSVNVQLAHGLNARGQGPLMAVDGKPVTKLATRSGNDVKSVNNLRNFQKPGG